MASTQEFQDEKSELELTPMIDVSFLILIFFMCLPFKTLAGKLQAYLPTDKGINPVPQEPPQEIKVSIHIVARDEKPRKWGPEGNVSTVEMPTRVLYRRSGSTSLETDDLEVVADWIKQGKQAASAAQSTGTVVKGEIKAGHKVPHKFVVAVLNKFAEASLEKVDFYGTAIPTKALRSRSLLPYPKRNYNVTD